MKVFLYNIIQNHFYIRKLKNLSRFLHHTSLDRHTIQKCRALVIAPHQDDETIGCGGTIKLITDAGGTVDIFYVHLDDIRKEEAKKARNILNASEVDNINLDYDVIFCPWMYDGHPDHAEAFNLMRKSIIGFKGQIWLYEVWTPLIPNTVVDISDTIVDKLEAIKAYKSQLKYIDYLEASSALAVYRGMNVKGKYAEAFICGNKKFILSL